MLDVGQQNDLPLNRRELRERRKQAGAQIGSLELANRSVGAVCRQRLLEWNESLASNRAQPIE